MKQPNVVIDDVLYQVESINWQGGEICYISIRVEGETQVVFYNSYEKDWYVIEPVKLPVEVKFLKEVTS